MGNHNNELVVEPPQVVKSPHKHDHYEQSEHPHVVTPKKSEHGKHHTEAKDSEHISYLDRMDREPLPNGPDEQPSPLMPHEARLGTWEPAPTASGERRTSIGVKISRMNTFLPPEPTAEDLNDPNLEYFPRGKANILRRIQTLKSEIPEDDGSQVDQDLTKAYGHHPAIEQIDWSKAYPGVDGSSSKSKLCQSLSSFKLIVLGGSGLDGILEPNPIVIGPLTTLATTTALLQQPTAPKDSYGTIKSTINEKGPKKEVHVKCVSPYEDPA